MSPLALQHTLKPWWVTTLCQPLLPFLPFVKGKAHRAMGGRVFIILNPVVGPKLTHTQTVVMRWPTSCVRLTNPDPCDALTPLFPNAPPFALSSGSGGTGIPLPHDLRPPGPCDDYVCIVCAHAGCVLASPPPLQAPSAPPLGSEEAVGTRLRLEEEAQAQAQAQAEREAALQAEVGRLADALSSVQLAVHELSKDSREMAEQVGVAAAQSTAASGAAQQAAQAATDAAHAAQAAADTAQAAQAAAAQQVQASLSGGHDSTQYGSVQGGAPTPSLQPGSQTAVEQASANSTTGPGITHAHASAAWLDAAPTAKQPATAAEPVPVSQHQAETEAARAQQQQQQTTSSGAAPSAAGEAGSAAAPSPPLGAPDTSGPEAHSASTAAGESPLALVDLSGLSEAELMGEGLRLLRLGREETRRGEVGGWGSLGLCWVLEGKGGGC